MPSPCDPRIVPAGDLGAALMMVDARLKAVYDGATETDPEQQQMSDEFIASMNPAEATAVLDGMCTLIHIFMSWLREDCQREDADVVDADVIGEFLPILVAGMRMLPEEIPPGVLPTMAGLLVASGTGLNPLVWRAQFGGWRPEEAVALEATAVLLATHVNLIAGYDHEYATRLISEALSRVDPG